MKIDNLEELNLSFLPGNLARERKNQLKEALNGLKKIRWPIKAVVLGGGYKHKELTYNQNNIGSDIDLFVFSNFIPFFWKKLKKIEKEINKQKHFFHYRGVIPIFLSKSRTFWAYRLKQEGIVLSGDKNILQQIRAKENNIPKIEAIRILFQTLVVWLMLAEIENKNSGKKVNPFVILRSYLNIGESYLTFFGCLRPSYQKRMEEFKSRIEEFRIEKELAQKIILGYLTKVDSEGARQESKRYQLSLSQAKRDCIKTANYLLSLYLKSDIPLDKKLEILGQKIRPKIIFNFGFFYFLKNLKEIKPRFFSIVFKFKITDLWKIVIYNEMGQKEKRDAILNRYFLVKNFSDETLIKIFESHPSISLMEIL